jgi:hypothetical protein
MLVDVNQDMWRPRLFLGLCSNAADEIKETTDATEAQCLSSLLSTLRIMCAVAQCVKLSKSRGDIYCALAPASPLSRLEGMIGDSRQVLPQLWRWLAAM